MRIRRSVSVGTLAVGVTPSGRRASGATSRTSVPRSILGMTSRGAVLADASARRECTLAYRITVDAVLARAVPNAGARRDGDSHASDATATRRPDNGGKVSGQVREASRSAAPGRRAGRASGDWVADIYPGRVRRERPNNCGECARAVDGTWHGAATTAAELVNRRVGGERPAIMSEWAGRAPEQASVTDIGRRLRELGPGSSAVVGFDRADAPGHWFNAVNHEGTVLAVDGQSARFKDWPPVKGRTGLR
jgi:hypothetical protein